MPVKCHPGVQLLLGTARPAFTMIHLPAAVPEQLSGVCVHMKQSAVIIRPLAAEALGRRSRLGELPAATAAPTVRAAPSVPHSVAPGMAAVAILTPRCRSSRPRPTRTHRPSWRGCVLPWGPGGEWPDTASCYESTEHMRFHLRFSRGDAYAGIAHPASAFAQPVASRLLYLQGSTEST